MRVPILPSPPSYFQQVRPTARPSLVFTTLENKARNLEFRANALGTRDMLIRWWMCPKRS